jgi:hypothetical protein
MHFNYINIQKCFNYLAENTLRRIYKGVQEPRNRGFCLQFPPPPFWGFNITESTITEATTGPLHQPQTMDDDECGAVGDRLCGLVVRVPGYRSRDPGSIPGTTRFSEKQWVWNGVHSAS